MTKLCDLTTPELRARALRAAQGQEPFDLLLTNGQVVNPATREILAQDIGIVGGLIASVHPRGLMDDAAQVIDCDELILSSGLIDSHMHIESSMVTPRRYAQTVLPQGTTTCLWDPHEVGNVAGLEGVAWAAQAETHGLRVMTLAPSCVPSAPGIERAGAEFNPAEMREMLSWDSIYGVAEVMDMRGVLEVSPKMAGIVNAGLASGKLVCGHARGLLDQQLQAFIASGIASDHEISGAEDFMQKLRAGLTIELRGSHDYVLPEVVAAINALGQMPQTITLCTDDVFPDDLAQKGGLSDHLRRLVAHGLHPLDALRAATLNASYRINRPDLGMIAAGRRADIVAFADLVDFKAEKVFVSGVMVGDAGRYIGPKSSATPMPLGSSIKLSPLSARDFMIPYQAAEVTVNTIKTPRFTQWSTAKLAVKDGFVQLSDDLLMMAVIHRHGLAAPIPSLGLLEDWGKWQGAIATTIAHDSHNLNIFGSNPEDMALAGNALIGCGGGMAVAKDGKLLALLELPYYGLLSDEPTEIVGERLAALRQAADQVADWLPPLRVFKALVGASLACNPGPHVTDMGLAEGNTGLFKPLIA